MQIRMLGQSCLALLAATLSLAGLAGQAQGKILRVANNGSDSSVCGSKIDPCRSISQAIANASAGDKIVVGPGRYGDLNGNGTFGETNEEPTQLGFGCFCMINVNKQVVLISRDGAFATVLDAGGAAMLPVAITASGVVFGRPRRGFLITGAGLAFNGLGMLGLPSGVTVAGNVASANGGSGFGFSGSGHMVRRNAATANGSAGFAIFGSGHLVRANLSSGNSGSGYSVSGTGHLLRRNVANANGDNGFIIFDTDNELMRNAALGNEGFEIQLVMNSGVRITRSNIFGNNAVPSVGLTNCGLFNQSGGEIIAKNNFWGEASGPGTDPADEVCDDESSETIFTPFTTKEFKVRVNPF